MLWSAELMDQLDYRLTRKYLLSAKCHGQTLNQLTGNKPLPITGIRFINTCCDPVIHRLTGVEGVIKRNGRRDSMYRPAAGPRRVCQVILWQICDGAAGGPRAGPKRAPGGPRAGDRRATWGTRAARARDSSAARYCLWQISFRRGRHQMAREKWRLKRCRIFVVVTEIG